MNELQASLQVVLANLFVRYTQALIYHWNVEGIQFPLYHEWFQQLYVEGQGHIDQIAEQIRILGSYAPSSVLQLQKYSTIDINQSGWEGMPLDQMLNRLKQSTDQVLASLQKVYTLADQENDQALIDIISSMMATYKLQNWKIESSLK